MKITSTLSQLGQATDDGEIITIAGTDDGTGDRVRFALDRLRYVAEVGGLLNGTGRVTFDVDDGQVLERWPAPVSGFRCPCCGDDVMGTPPLCDDCRQAGCEQARDGSGDLGWWSCQRDGGNPDAA